MREHKDLVLELPNFVPESLCKKMVEFFESAPNKEAGTVTYGDKRSVIPELKNSIDCCPCEKCIPEAEHEYLEVRKFIEHAMYLYKLQLKNEYEYKQKLHTFDEILNKDMYFEEPTIQKQPRQFHIFNISSQNKISLKNVAKYIKSISKKPIFYNLTKEKFDEKCIWADNTKAKIFLNFEPSTDLYNGLNLIIIPYKINKKDISKYIYKKCKNFGYKKSSKSFKWNFNEIYHRHSEQLKLVQLAAISNGGECLSKNYIDSKFKLKFR